MWGEGEIRGGRCRENKDDQNYSIETEGAGFGPYTTIQLPVGKEQPKDHKRARCIDKRV